MISLDELIAAQRIVAEPRPTVVERHRAQLTAAIQDADGVAAAPHSWVDSRRSVRQMLVVAAAVAAVALGAVAIVPFAPTGRSADALAVDAAAATAELLVHSGRAKFSTSDGVGTDVATYAFAGDDWSVSLNGSETARVVDGAHYVYTDVYGRDGRNRWWADGATVQNPIPDISGLLAVLSSTANFEIISEASRGVVPVKHLQAATPTAIPTEDLLISRLTGVAGAGQTIDITALELWIDDYDIVRQIDLSWTPAIEGSPTGYRTSIEFSDLGADIRIEPPNEHNVLPSDISD